MFRQVMSTVVEALLSIPPIRFVMGLVDARWRPLWATLWLAAIAYLLSRTMNQLALRRARLRLLREPQGLGADAAVRTPVDATPTAAATDPVNAASSVPAPTSRSADAVAAPVPGGVPMVPMPIVIGAVLVGAIVVMLTAVLLRRSAPNEVTPPAAAAAVDSAPAGALDVRWRSGRPNGDDCVATFEVSRGSGTRARFVAFVMDSSGAIMARDSARIESAVTGLLVDFRFRHVSCEEIADWQLQATTPKAHSP